MSTQVTCVGVGAELVLDLGQRRRDHRLQQRVGQRAQREDGERDVVVLARPGPWSRGDGGGLGFAHVPAERLLGNQEDQGERHHHQRDAEHEDGVDRVGELGR